MNKNSECRASAATGARTAKRVLVVEDDEGLNNLAQKALCRAGFDARGVLTGTAAIAQVAAESDLVLLLDQQLPDMDGTELVRALIAQERPIPFVAMTGHGDEQVAVEMMKLGARDYLVKGGDLTDHLPKIFEHVFRELETEQRLAQTEAALAWREERYKLLFNCGNDAIFVHPLVDGKPGRFSEVNDVACARLGYSREELLQMTPQDIDADGTTASGRRALAQLIQSGHCVFDMVHRAKSGAAIPVEISSRLFESAGRQYVLSTARDVSARRQTEKALRASEERYRRLFEESPISLWEEDLADVKIYLDGLRDAGVNDFGKYFDEHPHAVVHCAGLVKVVGVNKATLALYKAESLSEFHSGLGRTFCKESYGVFKEGLVAFAAGETKFEREAITRTYNGVKNHVVVRWTVAPGHEPVAAKLLVSIIDMTKRKRAEEKLRRELTVSQARAAISRVLLSQEYDINKVTDLILKHARKLTRSRHGFVSSIDQDTGESVAHTLTAMFGRQGRNEGRRMALPAGPHGPYPTLWGHALNTRKSFFTNQPQRHPSFKGLPKGHLALRNFMAVPVLIGTRPAGLIALANADTGYSDRQIEAIEELADIFALALHRNQYELEKADMEGRLRQMQKLEAIGTLAGGIAHDFNNILCPIVGMSEMLLEDFDPQSPEYENTAEILKAGRRGSDLVKQILAFSRQTKHSMIPLRIQSILKEVLKLSQATLPANIKIVTDIQADCGLVMADPTHIHQVVMNLITNAYHAMDENGGRIEVHLAETEIGNGAVVDGTLKHGCYAVLTVSDTGCGIAPDIIDKVFEPYFTTKPQGKGTGLGLAVVYGIVKEYGGDIKVTTEVGQGTSFRIYFPVKQKAAEAVAYEDTTEYPTGSEHILLVDDEAPVVRLESLLLERLGYAVTARTSSVEALAAFRANPYKFDLVITDMTMPNMTGEQLARALIAIRPDIPIAICTGFSERMNLEKAHAVGIKGFLSKPVVKSALARMVRQVLDGAHDPTAANAVQIEGVMPDESLE